MMLRLHLKLGPPGRGLFPVLFLVLGSLGCQDQEERKLAASSPEEAGRGSVTSPGPNSAPFALLQDRKRPFLDLNSIGYDQGDPDAPVKVIEVSDFGCGYCRIFNQQSFPMILDEYVKTGKVQWKFVPFVLGMFPNGDRAALASECAGDQGMDPFLRMRARLFSDQSGWRDTEDPNGFFTRLAEEEGLDAERFGQCLAREERAGQVEMDIRLGTALGVRGTPMFIIGGVPISGALPMENFRRILDLILAERQAPSRDWLQAAPTGGGPSIAGLAQNMGAGYSVGSPEAPVTILEFSDFGCGYCRIFQEQTRPVLIDEYVDAGLVQWTYVPFVLGIFPNGDAAAIAGECAGEQGDFESMRLRLYRDQAGWRDSADPDAFFTRLAGEEGLDPDRFSGCLGGDAARTRVRENTRLGQMAGVRGTPAFFINGFPVSGALPLEAFQDLLDLELSSLQAGS